MIDQQNRTLLDRLALQAQEVAPMAAAAVAAAEVAVVVAPELGVELPAVV